MYYHLNDHIYIAQFKDDLILLDTKKDNYMVCFQQVAESLYACLEKKQESQSNDIPPQMQTLLHKKIIELKKFPYPFYIDRKLTSAGVSNVDWRLPLNSKKIRFDLGVLTAFITLTKINCYMKIKGFYSTLQLIKEARHQQRVYDIPQEEELSNLAHIVNKACLIYPTRTKCLEWAMTYVLLALKRGWKCNLEIGVQNYPFLAHAWVECAGKMVMDDQSIREGLAIIVNEPFRMEKP